MKLQRQLALLSLINDQEIETQEELVELLNGKGYNTTQATVSRDIRELKISKRTLNNGKQIYYEPKSVVSDYSENYINILKDGFVSVDHGGNTVVVKTLSGMAMAVAAAIDEIRSLKAVGCIAGDDTIFCLTKGEAEAIEFMDAIKKIIG